MDTILYYFSGTGNSKCVSHWLSKTFTDHNITVKEYNLAKSPRRINVVPENTLIGFISPTHGFNFPPLMIHFILHFPRSANNKAFIMNTRAGMKAGRYFIPGLSGLAQFLTAIILLAKGYRIVGMRPVDLPSNWISLHPGLKQKVILSIFQRRRQEVKHFAEKLIAGGSDYTALKDLVQDILISPVGVLYYLFGRFAFAKSFIASSACNFCNLCIRECPVQAIKTINGRPFWTYKCESCMHCMNRCPQRAIETAHGFIAATIFSANAAILICAFPILKIDVILSGILPAWSASLLILLIKTLVFFGILLLNYRLTHYLLRFRWFEKLIVYTSLTKYKFWRRYRAPEMK
jgi:Pyruvate/2-oxoacid:ferredoxin oxidoreductase delta subunit